jgi:flavodoxin
MKRAIVIYDTKFGNTEKIARALARGMEKQGIKVDCVKADEVDIDKLVEYDFLVIGGPTHGFGVSRPMKAFLEKLRSVDLEGKKAFAFDTKIKASWLAGSAGKGIEKTLERLGMSIVKPHSSAIVKATKGPLKEGMEEMFEQIGGEIAESIQSK